MRRQFLHVLVRVHVGTYRSFFYWYKRGAQQTSAEHGQHEFTLANMNRLFRAGGLAVLLSVLAVLVEAGPKCGALMPNTGFPHAPAMDGSVKTGFEGSDDDCCALCAAKKGECAAFTHRVKSACYLHPASSPLGDTAPASGANSAYMPSPSVPTLKLKILILTESTRN